VTPNLLLGFLVNAVFRVLDVPRHEIVKAYQGSQRLGVDVELSGKLLAVDWIAITHRYRGFPLNALAPQTDTVCLPRLQSGFWPQGQLPPNDTPIGQPKNERVSAQTSSPQHTRGSPCVVQGRSLLEGSRYRKPSLGAAWSRLISRMATRKEPPRFASRFAKRQRSGNTAPTQDYKSFLRLGLSGASKGRSFASKRKRSQGPSHARNENEGVGCVSPSPPGDACRPIVVLATGLDTVCMEAAASRTHGNEHRDYLIAPATQHWCAHLSTPPRRDAAIRSACVRKRRTFVGRALFRAPRASRCAGRMPSDREALPVSRRVETTLRVASMAPAVYSS
jgi:hypothetical protein